VDVLIRFGVITVRLYSGTWAGLVRRRLVATTRDGGNGKDHVGKTISALHGTQDISAVSNWCALDHINAALRAAHLAGAV
jgi:hypothetical protein